jgi:hypothetical protein
MKFPKIILKIDQIAEKLSEIKKQFAGSSEKSERSLAVFAY